MKVVKKTSINLFENGSKLAILFGSKRPEKGTEGPQLSYASI